MTNFDDQSIDEERSMTPLETNDEEAMMNNNQKQGEKWRNLIAFFIVGLFNNFCYVVMLTAAEDLIVGYTGVVLLCDVLPAVLIKLTAPFYMHYIPYNLRVLFIVFFACLSFQTVAWFNHVSIKMIGIMFGALSSGAGEVTFLAMSSYYKKSTISAWSSGTGGAGIVGAFSYLLLRHWIGLSPRYTLFIVSPFPLLMLVSTFVLMTGQHAQNGFFSRGTLKGSSHASSLEVTFSDKLKQLLPLTRYMIPLFIVYYSEYLINQSVSPNLNFKTGLITHGAYVYYSNIYQAGVFVSRSSVSIFPIKRIWIPSLLQAVNFVILFLDAYFRIIPSIWFIFAIIFWEGLLGGSTYVNAFYRISCDSKPEFREFSMGVTSVADSVGIAISGVTSIFLQPWLKVHQSHRWI
jgi:battenin